MENFAPGLRPGILALTDALRVVVFFIAVVGLMMNVNRARGDAASLARPIVRTTVVVGLVATLPYWFGWTENIFLTLADTVHAGYTQHPMEAASRLRDSVADSATDFSLRRIGESLYKGFLFGAAKLVVLGASLLQLPFLVLQFILKLLCYLFLPIALALTLLPSLASVGVRYIQQTLAVLAWPVGFAITELVAYHLLTAYGENLATAYGLRPGEIDGASFASLLGGLLAALWLILGTLGTPFLMQALLCSGTPLSAGGGSALQQFYLLHQLAFIAKSLKSGGAAAPTLAARGAAGAASAGGGNPPPPAPPPAPLSPTTPPPPAAPARSAADPSGDARVTAALAETRLPTPRTTI
jgi:hypothetical protein